MPLPSKVYFGYYKVARFVFSIALLVAFQMVGLFSAAIWLFYMIAVYAAVAFIRLFITERSFGYLDFILDIIFISAMVFVSFRIYSYVTLFYLFPIFFASLSIKDWKIYLYPLLAIVLYGAIFYIRGDVYSKEGIFNLALHAFSFFLIAFAASHLNQRIERQEEYIRKLEEDKVRMQGYERLYRVSADLAHELRNPLASISAAAQFLKEGRRDADIIDMLVSETSRINNLVNDFLMFSRPTDAPTEDIDLCEMIRVISERYSGSASIETNLSEEINIRANKIYLDAAIGNIVRNAVEAAKNSVRISASKRIGLEMNDDHIRIDVEDDGPGISDDIKDRIFEPFVTSKSSGTGLGLALAYRVITSLGGNIITGVSQLGGAMMTIIFPLGSYQKNNFGAGK